ncbi:MAG TPA: PDZ domain-containing protein [Pirellulaceae bacterium]|nr:PDZ domain-containing protein [Pirellulaceae bacterium]
MKTDVRKRFGRIVFASIAALLATALVGGAWGQAPPASSGTAEAAREKAKETIQSAQETKQGAREEIRDAREGARDTAREDRRDTRNTREAAGDKVRDAREQAGDKIRDAREGARDTAREDRQTTRDAREGGRDTVRDDRQVVRQARREGIAARREFIAERIRSGDFGLFLRRMAGGLQVSDIANRGAIMQSGLKEGDEIVSVNGKPVTSEREFVDTLFADHESNKAAQVVIKRNGQQQTIAIQTKPFVDEHLASDNRLHDFGLILDESDPSHVKVQAVTPRSPAFYAGMRSGDQITGFNGQRINAVKDLISTIGNLVGNTTSVEIKRNNQPRQLDIEVPDEHAGDQTRTALKPALPSPIAAPPAQPQPQPTQPNSGTRTPPATQPRLNPPR